MGMKVLEFDKKKVLKGWYLINTKTGWGVDTLVKEGVRSEI